MPERTATTAVNWEWLRQSQRSLRWAAVGLLMFVALLLFARRMSGRFDEALSTPVHLICVLVAASSAYGIRAAHDNRRDVFYWLPSAALGLVFVALWLPGTAWWAILLAVAFVLSEEVAAWRRYSQAVARSRRSPRAQVITEMPILKPDAPLSLTSETIWQQLTNAAVNQGERYWRGSIRAELHPQQRTATVHVAFCPAFLGLPAVVAEQVDGPPAQIRVAQVLPQGARLEIRLDQECDAVTEVLLEFVATPRTANPGN